MIFISVDLQNTAENKQLQNLQLYRMSTTQNTFLKKAFGFVNFQKIIIETTSDFNEAIFRPPPPSTHTNNNKKEPTRNKRTEATKQ